VLKVLEKARTVMSETMVSSTAAEWDGAAQSNTGIDFPLTHGDYFASWAWNQGVLHSRCGNRTGAESLFKASLAFAPPLRNLVDRKKRELGMEVRVGEESSDSTVLSSIATSKGGGRNGIFSAFLLTFPQCQSAFEDFSKSAQKETAVLNSFTPPVLPGCPPGIISSPGYENVPLVEETPAVEEGATVGKTVGAGASVGDVGIAGLRRKRGRGQSGDDDILLWEQGRRIE